MKQVYKIASIAILTCMAIVVTNTQAIAQTAGDTLLVEWYDGTKPGPFTNNLFDVIQGDTTAEGERVPNRVYQLRKGGFYYTTEAIQNDGWHLNISGDGPKEVDADGDNPPMLQMSTREDGTTPGKMFNIRGDFTLKGAIVNGKTTIGELKYEIIDVRADDGRFIFDDVIFEYAQWGIAGFYSKNADIWITNSKYRNLVSETQPWGGRGFSVWADADTIWVENNTFMNIGGFTAQVEGSSPNFFLFNHNTIVNNGRQTILGAWLRDAYITNNLILNGFWQGESAQEISADRLASTDEQYAGMIAIDNLPPQYGLDASRNIALANNSFFLESAYTTYFTTDNDTFDIRQQPLLQDRVAAIFDANQNMVVSGNMMDTQDPGFTAYADNHADRIQFITDIRQANSPITLHYWDPGRSADNTSVQWPLPEDLTYSNATLKTAAIGGYPMGDLNWYPTEKATWWANRDAQYAMIKDLLGEPIVITPAGFVEAESGTAGGSAVTEAAPTRQLARIEASGNIVWDDVQMTAGTYDVTVSHRTWYGDSNLGRQTDISVNGGDNIAMTIEVEQDGTTWSDVTTTDIDFTEGTNTFALNKNWGYMEYQWVQIKEAGTENVVATLWPGEAALVDGGTYRCPDGGTCASGDNVIDTKDGGSISMNYDSEGNGLFALTVSYMLTSGDADVSVSVNGNEVANQTLSASGDSVLTELSLSNVPFTEGNNVVLITAASGGVQVDRVDFFVIGDFMSTPNELEPDLAERFELSQNYPNPFNPSTSINFTVPVTSDVQLTVFNLLGQKVATLVNERRSAGNHSVRFDARNLSSGVYFYQLQAGDFTLQRRMTLIK